MVDKKRVFIVEDNDLNLKLFSDLLNANEFDVTSTQDGFEAVKMVQDIKPNLILMDIQLHGISGLDLIREIKDTDGIKEIPIVAITAFAMSDDREKIMQSGCEEYMSKPISIETFLEAVNRLVS